MDYRTRYQEWLTGEVFDENTKAELKALEGNEKEIEDRFYRDLEFGTAGLRGIIGAGTNRMNKYTVGRATQGLANYILKKGIVNPSVAIAHDSRRFSRSFSEEAARVLNSNGIKVYLFEDLRPTPELSFAVRHLGTTAGIVVTASHNPPEYNGYKVYWSDGGQLVEPIASELIAEANSITDFSKIKCLNECNFSREGLLVSIGKEIDDIYIEKVKSLSMNDAEVKKIYKDMKIIYTPLHGAGNIPVRRVLKELGFEQLEVVPEQEKPDGNFPTVSYPNPEERAVFELGMKMAEKNGAELIFATDPDSDRVGVVVKNAEGEYVVLSGNQTGALLIDFVLGSMKRKGKLNEKTTIIDTIVSSRLGATVAENYGAQVVTVLTGFKHIADKINEFVRTGENEFAMAYEESFGYLAGDFVRDKDAVIASMLVCEMAAYHKSKGKTLFDALTDLYEKFGYLSESVMNIAFKGIEGIGKMKELIGSWRENPPKEIGGVKVMEFRDYMNYVGKIKLPKENAMFFFLENGNWFCLRPSGTEPKLKIYMSAKGKTREDAERAAEKLKGDISGLL